MMPQRVASSRRRRPISSVGSARAARSSGRSVGRRSIMCFDCLLGLFRRHPHTRTQFMTAAVGPSAGCSRAAPRSLLAAGQHVQTPGPVLPLPYFSFPSNSPCLLLLLPARCRARGGCKGASTCVLGGHGENPRRKGWPGGVEGSPRGPERGGEGVGVVDVEEEESAWFGELNKRLAWDRGLVRRAGRQMAGRARHFLRSSSRARCFPYRHSSASSVRERGSH